MPGPDRVALIPALDPVLPGKCHGCRLPPVACLCDEIPALHTRTRFVVVRHRSEIPRTSNTGRLVARALTNSLLVDHGLPGQPLDLTGVLGPDARVLAPGSPREENPRIATLVVLDGTWSQVRAMRHRIPPLGTLPAFSLPPPVVAPLRMREPLAPGQLATIEAVAAALDALGEPEPAERLRTLFARIATRMRELRYG